MAMTDATEPPVPIQRLKDIEDASVRDNATLGVQVTLAANLSHLRSIKDTEVNWLQLFAIITLPAIGYLMGVGDDNPLLGGPIILLIFFYLALTGWIQFVFLCERISYYSVLRSVVRAQNLLGLLDIKYLSPHFADSAFPREFGPRPEENGTQPQSSFLRRQTYTLVLYVGVLLAAAFRTYSVSAWFLAVAVLALAVDLAWLGFIFRRDDAILKEHTAAEEGLAGSDPGWFPRCERSEQKEHE
jgi:hypothetical protein